MAGMVAYVLNAMGDDLTAIVGAHVPQVPFCSQLGDSMEVFYLNLLFL